MAMFLPNEPTNGTRTGSMALAAAVSSTATNVGVQANGDPAVSAELYADNTFARDGVALANGTNVFVTLAEDAADRSATNIVVTHLPESVSLDYDQRGNLVGDGQKRFFYDDENQLAAVVVSNAWLSEFQYDGLLRRRVRKEYTWASGTGAWVETNVVQYVYDGRLVVQERHYDPRVSATVPQRAISYTRGNDLSGSLQEAGGIGGMLARTDSSASSLLRHALYHADGNGKITMLLATNGLVLASYHYDPYGNVLAASGPLAEANLYRFSSKEAHPNSGLVYYLYRYYEPKLQRWFNRDPIGEEGGINLHGYSLADPVNSVDPYGDCPALGIGIPWLIRALAITAETSNLLRGSAAAAGIGYAAGAVLTGSSSGGNYSMPPVGLSTQNAPEIFILPSLGDSGRGNPGERRQHRNSPHPEKTGPRGRDNQTGKRTNPPAKDPEKHPPDTGGENLNDQPWWKQFPNTPPKDLCPPRP